MTSSDPRGAVQRIWIGAILLLILLSAVGRVWLIPAHISADPNEGWNAFQAAHAMGKGALYPDPHALIGNNYPPLSFYIVGVAGWLVGDPIVAGRIFALLAVLAVSAGIFAIVRRLSAGDSRAPIVAGLLFLAYDVTLFRAYVALDDPQWLAHALMTAAIAILLPVAADRAPAPGRVVGAAVLMLLGGLVKHNLLALPLAATLWLLLHHRRAALLWIGTAAAGLALAAMLCRWAYGPDMFVDLLASDRHYSWLRMVIRAAPVLIATLPLIVVSAGLVRYRRGDVRIDLLLIAVAISVPLGILQRSGQGVDRNAHFEALIALCMASGVALSWTGFSALRPFVRRPLPWLTLPLLCLAPDALKAGIDEIADYPAETVAWQQAVARIAATPGPVACEMPALCYWAGKDFALDFFLYGQRVAVRHDAAVLEAALAAHRFTMIVLEPGEPAQQRVGDVPDPLPAIIASRYRVGSVDDDDRQWLVPAD